MTTPQSQRGYPTATAAVQAQLASDFYLAQASLASMAVMNILAIWRGLDLRDVRSSWPGLRKAIADYIGSQFTRAVHDASVYYQEARIAADVPGFAPVTTALPVSPALQAAARIDQAAYERAVVAARTARATGSARAEVPTVSIAPPSPQLLTATLDSTGPYGLLGRIKEAQPLEQAAETTGVVMSGAASRLISNGARQAIVSAVQADPQAVAWMRVTAANPCSWCAMIASRGPVFKSAASAGFKAHSHCRCTAQPVFSKEDADALRDNDLYQQWKQVTLGLSGADARRAWRRYWDQKMGRDGIRVLPAA